VKVVDETKRGARLRIESTDEAVLAGTLKRMIIDGLLVTDFHREERRLEDAFIDMLGQIDKGSFKGETAGNVTPQIPPPLPPQ
jgi:ABC-2 type transport system ATP-binding protein